MVNLLFAALLMLLGGAAAQDDEAPDALPWWNDRVFYEIFVRSFYDSDGDGIGDLRGIIEKLDYLNDGDPETQDDLGVTGIWLMPITESPSYHGYDVAGYKQIEADYGTSADFMELVQEAHARGIVVIVDLVANHTSSQHPWFLSAVTPGSTYDDWYRWETTPQPDEVGAWGQPLWNQAGSRYYYAYFGADMPDLNYTNPEVTEAMYEVARYWLEGPGVDGFRLDAIKHLFEDEGVYENLPETHAWLQNFNTFIHEVNPDALAVGEVWSSSAEAAAYIDGGELDLTFEFDLAEAMLVSAGFGNSYAVRRMQPAVDAFYPQGQYAAFLTNHDQNRVVNALAGDLGAARVAATMLLTQPGVPFIYYGEEIGMVGEKPDERIRTPMQWDDTPNTAGFTETLPWTPLSAYYDDLNVSVQTGDPDSLLSHYRELIRLRSEHPALRRGAYIPVESDSAAVYSFIRHHEDETLLVVINLSDEPVEYYNLSLESGPLLPMRDLTPPTDSEIQPPAIDDNGGFNKYMPLPLGPHSSIMVRLMP